MRRDGFGHVAFSVHDVYEFSDELQKSGVKFQSFGLAKKGNAWLGTAMRITVFTVFWRYVHSRLKDFVL